MVDFTQVPRNLALDFAVEQFRLEALRGEVTDFGRDLRKINHGASSREMSNSRESR